MQLLCTSLADKTMLSRTVSEIVARAQANGDSPLPFLSGDVAEEETSLLIESAELERVEQAKYVPRIDPGAQAMAETDSATSN